MQKYIKSIEKLDFPLFFLKIYFKSFKKCLILPIIKMGENAS